MNKQPLDTGMNSNRVLLSTQFYHPVDLTEQEIGVIIHGLIVLGAAFSMEYDYERLVQSVRIKMANLLEQDAEVVPEP